jgi:hypothetical protein
MIVGVMASFLSSHAGQSVGSWAPSLVARSAFLLLIFQLINRLARGRRLASNAELQSGDGYFATQGRVAASVCADSRDGRVLIQARPFAG